MLTRFEPKHRSISNLVSVVLSELYKIACQKGLNLKIRTRRKFVIFLKLVLFLGIEDFFQSKEGFNSAACGVVEFWNV